MMPSDVKTIVDNLEDFIEVTNGIERLRMAVRTLAVSGRLVPQDLADGTGEELFKQIEETRLLLGSRKRKDKGGIQVNDSETPFEIPKSWKWVRFGYAFDDYGSGSTPSRGSDVYYKNGQINWYKSGELKDGILIEDSEEKITSEALEKCHLRLNKPGDLLLAMYGATAGRLAILNNQGTTNQAVWGGTPNRFVSLDYLFLYMMQSRSELLKMSSGAAQPNISGEKILLHVLPLPPLAEQLRIVQKTEEVMRQLDELEIQKQERDEIHKRLTRNVMHSLGLGDTKIALANLTELVKSKDDLKELEESIITLGISGKLVPQNLIEGTAEDLFVQVQKERHLIQGRKIKENKIETVTSNEVPFLIPTLWKWVRLGELGETQTGTTPKNGDSQSYGNDFPFIKPADISVNEINYENKGLSKYGVEKYGRMASAGSSLMVCIGTIGKTNIIERNCSFNQQINSITPSKCLDSKFVQLVLRSSYFQNEAWSRSSRTTLAILNKGKWEKIPFPLPPFIEQKRIVKKIEEIMDLIKSLRLVLLR